MTNSLNIDIQTKLLRSTYLVNLAYLKKEFVEVYDAIKDHKFEETKLTFDERGCVNLVNNGSLVYDGDPKALSIEQVDYYFEQPKLFAYSSLINDETRFIHEERMAEIDDIREEMLKDSPPVTYAETLNSEEMIDAFIALGTGLGYHLEELFKRKKFKHFFLYESSYDVFVAFLHVVSLEPMVTHCRSNHGTFTILLSQDDATVVNTVYSIFQKQGQYLVSRTHLYRHYNESKIDDTFKKYGETVYRIAKGWGFFEDELIGLQHSIYHVKNKLPFLSKTPVNTVSMPAFVVGNGPSLDQDLDFLKEHQDKVVIISCGTAFRTLYKHGIVPDIHVEQERNRYNTEVLKRQLEGIDDKEIEHIRLMALNTVFPESFELFKESYVIPKIGDSGTVFLSLYDKEESIKALHYVNPTVTNCGLMCASSLGFDSVYLFGSDLGYLDPKKHHASSSIYHDGSWKEEEKFFDDYFGKGNRLIEGNLRDEVYTNDMFDMSRGVFEFAIKSLSNTKVFNCSDGVKIHGASPIKSSDISPQIFKEGKQRILKQQFKKAFKVPFKDQELDLYKLLENRFIPNLGTMIAEFNAFVENSGYTREGVCLAFDKQYSIIKNLENDKSTRLYMQMMRGSMTYFHTQIISNSYRFKDRRRQSEFLKATCDIYCNHLLELLDKITKNIRNVSDV